MICHSWTFLAVRVTFSPLYRPRLTIAFLSRLSDDLDCPENQDSLEVGLHQEILTCCERRQRTNPKGLYRGVISSEPGISTRCVRQSTRWDMESDGQNVRKTIDAASPMMP